MFFLCITLSSCNLQDSRKSHIFIFAVDKLDFESVNCLRESSSLSGFDQICESSVRFTNAYTTSVLSTAAMASLMSGLYPFEHKVHHSIDSMSAEINTHAKQAIRNGYKTFFYSSSPEIMSKNGFNQGFNSFDDSLSKNKPYRNLEENIKAVKKNLANEVSENSYHLIHVSDLSRDLSQLENIDFMLGDFFYFLKKNKLWNNSIVVLVGLQGKNSDQEPLQDSISLFKKTATRVSFLFKNAQKQVDQKLKWQIDKTINLADVGRTLLDLYEAKESNLEIQNKITDSVLKKYQTTFSLKSAIFENKNLEFSNRSFLIENFWHPLQLKKNNISVLRKNANISYSLRQDSQLFIFAEKDMLFNSLMDPLETTPITNNSEATNVLFKDLKLLEQMLTSNITIESRDYDLDFKKNNALCKDFEVINTFLETTDFSNSTSKLDLISDRYDYLINLEPLEKQDSLWNYVLDYNYLLKLEKFCIEFYLKQPQYNNLKLKLQQRNPKR